VDLNPFSHEFHEDPHPTYRWLRENAPLYRNERFDFWALSRFRDVLDASHDWQTYSSAQGTTIERIDGALFGERPMMIFTDPPRHDRLRKLVNRVFTPRRIAELEPFARATVVALLEPLAARGGGDIVKDLSALLPMEMIFTMLGVPEADRIGLRRHMDASLDRDRDTGNIPAHALAAMGAMMSYWDQLVADLRVQPNVGLISALLEAEIETDDGGRTRLTSGEIVGFCSLIGVAGNETVTKLLANAAVLFSRHPGEYEKILADPAVIPNAVEEVLRYSSPSQYQGRVTTRDVEWYGTRVPAGSRILLLTGSANRDEREFDHPDRFDVERKVPIALGFGQGIHFCLGASLARLEMRVALEEFGRSFPRFAVDEARCARVHMSNVHGYMSVPFAAQ
jgi:cytochrome P450